MSGSATTDFRTSSNPLLEQSSQAFITRVTNERTAYINSKTVQLTEGERAKAERVVRNECVESIKQPRSEVLVGGRAGGLVRWRAHKFIASRAGVSLSFAALQDANWI